MADILQAKMLAIAQNPYLRDAIAAMRAVETMECPRAAVDQYWRLYWNPEWFATLSPKEAAGVVLHEVDHLIDRDHVRVQKLGITESNPERARLARVWNYASDAVINERRRREGVQLPGDAIYPETVGVDKHSTKEEAYFALLKQLDSRKDGDGQGAGGAGDENPEPCNGSGADGISRQWESAAPSEKKYGQPAETVREDTGDTPAGLTESQAKAIIRKTAEAIRKAGVTSGGWSEIAQAVLDVPVDPRKVFRKAFRRAVRISGAGSLSTYRRASRQKVPGFILPGKMGVEPNLRFILDTSGSMSIERDIALAMGFINKTLKKLGMQSIDLSLGDTELKKSVAVKGRMSSLEVSGRGGTDMGRLIMLAAEAKPKPEGIVIITDGYTPWCKPISIPVFAILTQRTKAPDWITSVHISEIEE